MSSKFLPIGTICTIKGNNKKVMITGYFSVEYTDKIKMFDYSGCSYPVGLMKHNQNCSFNHDDILSVEYKGYITEEFKNLNKHLLEQTSNNLNIKIDSLFENIEFDKNGVVTFASETKNTQKVDNSSDNINNPFLIAESDRKYEQKVEDADKWPIFSKLEFDENGVVIGEKE